MSMVAWNVFIGYSIIDTVFFTSDCDEWYVRHSLVNHDGYPDDIRVKRVVKELSLPY